MKLKVFSYRSVREKIKFLMICALLFFVSFISTSVSEENKNFTIAYASQWSPISYGVGGEVDGILPRLMDEIFSGIEGFELTHNGLPWERAQKMFFGGGVDGMVTTATKKRMQHAEKSSEAALEIPFHPIIRRNSELKDKLLADKSLQDLRGYRYCDVLGNGWAEEFYKKRDIEFSIAPTIDHCLLQLQLNRVDIVIHAKPVLEIFKKKLGLDEELELVDLKYDESPKFPLLVSNSYSHQDEITRQFDQTVMQLKESGRYDAIMNKLIASEKNKAN
jgi:polar amino acid transport system substrate-binding protein